MCSDNLVNTFEQWDIEVSSLQSISGKKMVFFVSNCEEKERSLTPAHQQAVASVLLWSLLLFHPSSSILQLLPRGLCTKHGGWWFLPATVDAPTPVCSAKLHFDSLPKPTTDVWIRKQLWCCFTAYDLLLVQLGQQTKCEVYNRVGADWDSTQAVPLPVRCDKTQSIPVHYLVDIQSSHVAPIENTSQSWMPGQIVAMGNRKSKTFRAIFFSMWMSLLFLSMDWGMMALVARGKGYMQQMLGGGGE